MRVLHLCSKQADVDDDNDDDSNGDDDDDVNVERERELAPRIYEKCLIEEN